MSDIARDAGRVIDGLGMVWTRRLEASLDDVWLAVSTSEGLQKWWLSANYRRIAANLGGVPRYSIDLSEGGIFLHHWRSTVADFKEHEYIEFENVASIGGGMRFATATQLCSPFSCTAISHPVQPAAGMQVSTPSKCTRRAISLTSELHWTKKVARPPAPICSN